MTKDQEVLMAVLLGLPTHRAERSKAKQSLLQRNPAFGQKPEYRTA
jgi:hypothetical protein